MNAMHGKDPTQPDEEVIIIDDGEEFVEEALSGDFHAQEAEEKQAPAATAASTDPEEDAYQVLQRQFDEQRAANKATEDRLNAELREKQALQQRVQHFETSEVETHRALIEHAIAATGAEIETARRAYREARAVNDVDAELAATEMLSDANNNMRQLKAGHEEIQRRLQNPPPRKQEAPAAGQDPVEQIIVQNFPNPRDQAWLRQHKQDVFGNEDRKELALAGHKVAVLKHGLQPGTDAYYAFLDDHMGYAAAESAKQAAEAKDPKPVSARAPAAPRKAVLPGAPVSRTQTPAKGGSSVRVTREVAELAKDLGMTASEYLANQAEIASGKSHHRFS